MQSMDEVLATLDRAEKDLRNLALNWEAIGGAEKLRAAAQRLTMAVGMAAAKARATQLELEATGLLVDVEMRARRLEALERGDRTKEGA